MAQTVIINEQFKNSPFEKIVYSGSIACDVLFSACQPSLACKVIDLRRDPSSSFDKQLAVMEKMQNQFKNCFAVILIDPNDDTTWDRIQLKLKGGLLRLFLSSTLESSSSIILDYYKLMKNSIKLQQQSTFFEKEKYNLSSPNTAAAIAQETLDRIGIGSSEVNMLMDSLPSIKELVAADSNTLQDVPIDIESLQAVEQFFSIDTTSV